MPTPEKIVAAAAEISRLSSLSLALKKQIPKDGRHSGIKIDDPYDIADELEACFVAGITARVHGIEDEIFRIANSLSDTHTDLVPFTEQPTDLREEA